jgi:3-hydroxyisobutyrate dehydrogenase-like beta-hydroxyacid dehydrogenase
MVSRGLRRHMTTIIGFIGLGQMGHGVANNFVSAGYSVVVHDVRRSAAADLLERGARWAQTSDELAAESDVLFTSLPTPAIVQSVAYGSTGVIDSLKSGAAWFDLSTNSLELVRRLHADLLERGVDFFDAPVSGGPAGAQSGKLAIWVGGDKTAFDRHSAVLDHVADQIRLVGDIGAGTTAKLLHNVVSAAIHAVTAEALSVGIKAGIEPAALYETLRSGAAGRRRSFDALMPRFMAGTFEPASFQLQLAHKDIALARRLSQDVGVPTRICDLVYDEVTEAMNRGWAERDAQSFLLLQQERAGIDPIAVPKETLDAIRDRT